MPDTNILTRWRQALVAHLSANLQDGSWDVRSGSRDGAVKDRKLAVVFVPRIASDAGNVNYARPPMVIRAWIPQSRQPRTETPTDPEPLEQLAVDLMACLQPVQTRLLEEIYFWVADSRIDYQDWGVQATLASWTANPATLPLG